MTTGVTFEAFINAIKHFFILIYGGFKRVGNTISEVRSTYKESFVEEEEITEEVIEANSDVIFEEAENRLHAQKAVLVKLLS